ncbi:InlB B-repeat-containing protein [Candidatus Saccharibacteria bacterium]|nr:InlB B-repeat-containing protein [Candidatus Saccharibacteria bacterium]
MHQYRTYIGVGSLLGLTLLSGAVLTAPRANADTSGTVDITINVPTACSLSATNNTLTKTINPGTADTIGTSNIKALCNDANGFAIYAVGYTDEQYGNNYLTTDLGDNYKIATNNTASPSTSQWNMTIDNDDVTGDHVATIENDFDQAHIIPTTYTKIASFASATDQTIGSNLTAQFDAYIAPNQPAGTYQGKVKFVLVHPSTHTAPDTPIAVSGQICYYGNGADSGSMACQTTIDINNSTTALSANAEAQLRASNFSRAGYGFTGWNTKEDGTGTQYGPMETITFTEDMYNNGLVLFANWKAAETGVTMQTFNDTISPYSTMPNGSVIALKDIRDNDVYAIAKLADGNWWMIENLRLDYDANITPTNTQSNNSAFGGVFAGLAEPETDNFSNTTIPNSLYTTNTASTTLKVITGSYQSFRFPRYNNSNTASPTINSTNSYTNIYSYGNYYSWPAAVADTTYHGATNNQSATTTSLCPTGWHLPKGGNKSNEANSEWWILANSTVGTNPANYTSRTDPYYVGTPEGPEASNALRRYPNNLVYSGYYFVSFISFYGSQGRYWSSTVSTAGPYQENLTSSFVYPGTEVSSYFYGLTVRCLAD